MKRASKKKITKKKRARRERVVMGWREWVSLPEVGVAAVAAKLDTGARSSALHVTDLDTFERDDCKWVRFVVDPHPSAPEQLIEARAPLHDERVVRSSLGHEETRFVIRTVLVLGTRHWPIDLTLTGRHSMRYRMLLGREALRGRIAVDPSRSFLAGVPPGALVGDVEEGDTDADD